MQTLTKNNIIDFGFYDNNNILNIDLKPNTKIKTGDYIVLKLDNITLQLYVAYKYRKKLSIDTIIVKEL